MSARKCRNRLCMKTRWRCRMDPTTVIELRLMYRVLSLGNSRILRTVGPESLIRRAGASTPSATPIAAVSAVILSETHLFLPIRYRYPALGVGTSISTKNPRALAAQYSCFTLCNHVLQGRRCVVLVRILEARPVC